MDVNPSLALEITRAASKQTYYTIRMLADRDRVEDAFRAYAYFRWLDDALDADGAFAAVPTQAESLERQRFLDGQKSLLERCLHGEAPHEANPEERLLIDLTQHADVPSGGLRAYLQNMMQVMDFDVRRRGRLISQAELSDYTRSLAVAVTEALHYFIGHGACAPHDETRYMAASAAHIMHMLRDTYDDTRLGYYNIPREVLEAGAFGPEDVRTDAYRAWVKHRVQLARAYFQAGKAYLARVQNRRCQLAGLTYMARFEWLTETLEKEDFRIRPRYAERKQVGTALRMGWQVLSWTFDIHALASPLAQPRGHL